MIFLEQLGKGILALSEKGRVMANKALQPTSMPPLRVGMEAAELKRYAKIGMP